MSLVHSIGPGASFANRFARFLEEASGSSVGLGVGLALSAMVGAPTPLPPVALAGPVVASLAAGSLGGRAAAAVGFVSYLAMNRPEPGVAFFAAAVATIVGWAVPSLVSRCGLGEEKTSAIVIDGDGFASLDQTYGVGSRDHAFDLLRRALEIEARESGLLIHAEGRELILMLDGATPRGAEAIMARVDRRFAAWLSDAGYECDLSMGLTGADAHDDLLRAARRSRNILSRE